MTDLIVEKIYDKPIFTWSSFKMVKADELRQKYIRSLKEADKGNIKPLLDFARS